MTDLNLTFIDVNGRTFVSGLLWKPLRSSRNYMREAKEIGKKQGMEMVAIRRSKVLQAGFAKKFEKVGRKAANGSRSMRNMYSLASSLAGVLGDNWIGAFDLGDDRYAFVAVYQGGIMPGKDLVADRGEVEALFRETYSDVSADSATPIRVITPAVLEAEFGGEVLTLLELLPTKAIKSDYKLKPLTFGLTTRQLLIGGIALGAVVAGGIGVNAYLDYRAEAARAHKGHLHDLLMRERKQAALQRALAAIPRLWQTVPDVADFIKACGLGPAGVWVDVKADIRRWRFETGKCVVDTNNPRVIDHAEASYRRDDGATVADFRAGTAEFGAAPRFSEAFEVGTIARKLVLPSPENTLPATKLPKRDRVVEELVDLIHRLPPKVATFSITDKPWKPPLGAPADILPDWKTSTVTIQSTLSPDVLLAGFDTPALRLTEIDVSVGAGKSDKDSTTTTWSLKGEIYGH